MNSGDIDKAYFSPYDIFMAEFDSTHPKTKSQLDEIKKHEVIQRLRDDKEYQKNKTDVWSDF
jgi:hypothetical protein